MKFYDLTSQEKTLISKFLRRIEQTTLKHDRPRRRQLARQRSKFRPSAAYVDIKRSYAEFTIDLLEHAANSPKASENTSNWFMDIALKLKRRMDQVDKTYARSKKE